MTLAQARAGYTAQTGYLPAEALIMAFDISDEQSLLSEDYTVADEGVTELTADFSGRDVQRRYVDGDRCVPCSDMRRFTMTFLHIPENAVLSFILSRALSGEPIKYACEALSGNISDEGGAIARVVSIKRAEPYGAEFTVLLTSCKGGEG